MNAPATNVATMRADQPNATGALSFPKLLESSMLQIKAALPRHMTPERLIRVALTAFRQQPLLAKCEPKSVLASVFVAAQLGLEVGVLGQAYLLPFWNRKGNSGKGGYDCQLIVGYQGYIELARRTGQLVSVETHVIYEKDSYTLRYGLNPEFEHTPYLDGDPGKPRMVYCIARFKDGGQHLEVMTWEDIQKIKGRSPAKNREGDTVGPWISDEIEMARKTVVRRARKYWPQSVELATASFHDGTTAKLEIDGGELFAQIEHVDEPIEGSADHVDDAVAMPKSKKKGEAQPATAETAKPSQEHARSEPETIAPVVDQTPGIVGLSESQQRILATRISMARTTEAELLAKHPHIGVDNLNAVLDELRDLIQAELGGE